MFLSLLPREIINYIALFVFTECEICFKKIVYWNICHIKDIYKIKMINNSYKFIYLFLNSDKKTCAECYCLIKYWFR